MSLKVGGLCKASPTIIAYLRFCQFCNVFDQRGVPFINSDRHNVFQLVRRVLSKMPVNFTVLLELRFVYPDSHPFKKLFSFVQVGFYLVNSSRDVLGTKAD